PRGGAGHERPRPCLARGPAGRRAVAGGAERGGGHAPGDRRSPGRGPERGVTPGGGGAAGADDGAAQTPGPHHRRRGAMKRLLGVFLMVASLWLVVVLLQIGQLRQQVQDGDEMRRAILSNQQTIASRLGFYGLLTVGVGLLILSGGIDLSIGSVIGLTA